MWTEIKDLVFLIVESSILFVLVDDVYGINEITKIGRRKIRRWKRQLKKLGFKY